MRVYISTITAGQLQPHCARSSTLSDRPQGARIAGASRIRFNLLAHSSFGGTPYSLDKAGIVECVTKSRRSVCPLIQIAGKLSVDLPHIDRRLHDVVGDSWRVGFCECGAGPQCEVPSLTAIGVVTGQAQPSIRSLISKLKRTLSCGTPASMSVVNAAPDVVFPGCLRSQQFHVRSLPRSLSASRFGHRISARASTSRIFPKTASTRSNVWPPAMVSRFAPEERLM